MKASLTLVFALGLGSVLGTACATAPAVEPVQVHVRLAAGPRELAHTSKRTGFLLQFDRTDLNRRLRRSVERRGDLVLVGPESAQYEVILTVDEVFGPELIGTSDLFPGTQDYWVRVKLGTLVVRRGAEPKSVEGVEWMEAEQKLVYETHGYPLPRRESRVFERAIERAARQVFEDFAQTRRSEEGPG